MYREYALPEIVTSEHQHPPPITATPSARISHTAQDLKACSGWPKHVPLPASDSCSLDLFGKIFLRAATWKTIPRSPHGCGRL